MTNKLKYFALTLMLFVALGLTFEQQAHAYIDPGSGLLIFQSISAIVSGALIYFRRRIKNHFVRERANVTGTISPSAIDPR